MKRTFIYDRDLDAMVEIGPNSNRPSEPLRSSGVQIIRDIEPYRAAASDVAAAGKRPVIGGRRQHAEFLRRNGYVEVGNEKPIAPSSRPSERQMQQDRVHDIKRAGSFL